METTQTKRGTKRSCQCEDCQAACRRKPGWFAPGEAERAARFMRMGLQTFFKKYLLIDWWAGSPTQFDVIQDSVGRTGARDTYVLSPAIVGRAPGGYFPRNPAGQCVFFRAADGLCAIHPVKPMECRETLHAPQPNLHRDVARLWDTPKHQRAVVMLLSKKDRP